MSMKTASMLFLLGLLAVSHAAADGSALGAPALLAGPSNATSGNGSTNSSDIVVQRQPAAPGVPRGTTSQDAVALCAERCVAAVAACSDATPFPALVKAVTTGYGCNESMAPASCQDLPRLLSEDGIFAGQMRKQPTNAKTASPTTLCAVFASQCQTFCLNDRQTAQAVVLGGVDDAAINGHNVSALPVASKATELLDVAAAGSFDTSGQMAAVNVHADFIDRPPQARSGVHFHSNLAVACVLEGCTVATVEGLESATYCAADDGTPTCFLMPAWRKIVNLNPFDKRLRLIDVGINLPGASFYNPIETIDAGTEPV